MTYVFIVPIVVLALLYYFFHRSKSTFLSIVIFGFLLYFIIKYLVDSEISMGVGIGLFGIMTLIRFRETFENPVDIIYLFVSISFAILSVFIADTNIFVLISLGVLLTILFVEMFLKEVNSCKIVMDIDAQFDKKEFEEKMGVRYISSRLQKVDMYKLSKEYVVYYSNR